MVRLKVWDGVLKTSQVDYFNSTMVRLKVRTVERPEVAQADFNSTMVRLKASH